MRRRKRKRHEDRTSMAFTKPPGVVKPYRIWEGW